MPSAARPVAAATHRMTPARPSAALPALLPVCVRHPPAAMPALERIAAGPTALPSWPRHALAIAAAGCLAGLPSAAWAQAGEAPPPPLQPSTRLAPAPEGAALRERPTIVQAQTIRLRPDIDAVAEGEVEFRRAGTVIRADRLSYDSATDRAVARGHVQIERSGARYKGTELQLQLQRFEGFFLQPEFEFPLLGAGGRADRVDFLDSARSSAERARYTSCPRDEGSEPDWVLRADRVRLDLEANEGIAEGAVLQFLGVPILGLPVLSFPLTDDRKSGWLPPTVLPVDSRNGFTLGVPYYWNIAPNRDATLTPTVYTRRGLALDGEFRYLEPRHEGRIRLHLLPSDRAAGRSRLGLALDQQGWLGADWRYGLQGRGVSDDDYWKDFPQHVAALSPRLLAQNLSLERAIDTRFGMATVYARTHHWQVLQTGSGGELIVSPYQRSPQLGMQLVSVLPRGWKAQLGTEVNRFTLADRAAVTDLRTGWRWHALGQASRTWGHAGAWLTPKLAFNAAAYAVEQPGAATVRGGRLIPTASLDAGMVFERDSRWFGRAQRQTLEPRVLWANTPYREQAGYPNFDAAERDFNAVSIFAENAFSGIDRVADVHQVTAGVTTRLVDADTGAETLRLGIAQRVRLRDQRVVLSGQPQTQRFSDLLVEGSTSVFQPWQLDAALQYNPDGQRVVRSILGARYSPGPFRTISAGYRLARGLSEQFELGWQWPVYRGTSRPVGAASGCGGTVYAVGRLNYSMKDTRITDSLVGLEYDSGCWIGRVVAERSSTGRAEATTRLLLQLELVGLSRLGASPLQVLKDNIPGYRLLREPRGSASTGPFAEP
jgi:LPS-assembly protein